MLLKLLKEIVLNGQLMNAGELVQTENPELFILNKYARKLTEDENKAILSEYIAYADKIFNKPQRISSKNPRKQVGIRGQQERLPL